MAIRHPKKFKEAAPAGFDGVFDWDFLMPAFEGTKVSPMDFDGVIERRMKFLVFETKSKGVEIPKGQIITLENLVKTGFFMVIVLRAKKAIDITEWELWFLSKNGRLLKKAREGNSVALTNFVRDWFLWATNKRTLGNGEQ